MLFGFLCCRIGSDVRPSLPSLKGIDTDYLAAISPWNVHRKTHEAYTEFGKYMAELYEAKKSEISAGKTGSDGLDLLGRLFFEDPLWKKLTNGRQALW